MVIYFKMVFVRGSVFVYNLPVFVKSQYFLRGENAAKKQIGFTFLKRQRAIRKIRKGTVDFFHRRQEFVVGREHSDD